MLAIPKQIIFFFTDSVVSETVAIDDSNSKADDVQDTKSNNRLLSTLLARRVQLAKARVERMEAEETRRQ